MKAVNLSHELHYRIPRLLLAIKVDLSPSPRPSVSLTTEQNMIVLEGICQIVAQYPNQAALVEAEAGLVWAFYTNVDTLLNYLSPGNVSIFVNN